MHIMRLRVNEGIYEKLMWFLNKFDKDELEIISETEHYTANQNYLAKELDEIVAGEAKFLSMEEVEQRLENIIKKHEDTL